MIQRTDIGVVLVGVALTVLLPPHAGAQVSLSIDPSVRSAGMGGASTAVYWSDDVNGWANPALHGFATGFRYRWSDTRLVPDLAPDVTFQTDRFNYGWGGVGLAVGSHALNYGRIELTDPQGTPIGTFEPTEEVRLLGGGFSLARTLEAVAALRGGTAPRFARYADIAAGFNLKRVRLRVLPAPFLSDASLEANDFGVLVRATPLPKTETGRPSLDLTYGFAALNYNVALASISEFDVNRHGVAARVAFPLPQSTGASLERRFGRWIASGMDPLVSVVVAADFTRFGQGTSQFSRVGDDQFGVELAILNTLSVRFGHTGPELSGIDGYSFGAGIGFSLADFAGARYDYARYPQCCGLSGLDRHAIAAWFDPVAFVQR